MSSSRIIAFYTRFILLLGRISFFLEQGAEIAGPDAKCIARAALCAAAVAPVAGIHVNRSPDAGLWHRRHDRHLLYCGGRPAPAPAIPRSLQVGGACGYR